MKIDMKELSPWADIHTMFTRMKSFRIVVGEDVYDDEMDISSTDGHVTLKVKKKKKQKAKLRLVK